MVLGTDSSGGSTTALESGVLPLPWFSDSRVLVGWGLIIEVEEAESWDQSRTGSFIDSTSTMQGK